MMSTAFPEPPPTRLHVHLMGGMCYLTLIHTASLRKLKGTGGLSAARSCRPAKSIVSLASRGGVPVFSLPTAKPSLSRVRASPMAGWSPSRPAGCVSRPMWITPLRNVPVVRITLPARTVLPSPGTARFQRCAQFSSNKALEFWCFCLKGELETTSISEPNEFDIMLVIPIKQNANDSTRLQLDESDDTGAYYYASFKRGPIERGWLKFLEEDGKLSASKMMQALRDIIKQEVKNIRVTVARKRAGSPAITLQIKKPPLEISVDIILTLKAQKSWPPSTQDGLKIEQWLGTKKRRDFRLTPIYLVAKSTDLFGNFFLWNTWRLSFSHIEKDMIKNHGNSKTCCESNGPKCCRKGCLKLLKFLLEQLKRKYPKELEKFCSYHVKTAFLHSCVMWPNDTDWYLGNLDHSFQQCLGFFVDCLQKSQLTHFFIPQYNLLSQEDKARHHFLSRKISYELNNGFPVFHENY
uniref:Cyclic GMP-AMP synthase n=1 Tax=Zonotrichia albicollis TaxID=44394 RepID=A0A8D2M6Y8_ZONAL